MTGASQESPVAQLGVALTVPDFEAAVRFVAEVLGMRVEERFDTDHDSNEYHGGIDRA